MPLLHINCIDGDLRPDAGSTLQERLTVALQNILAAAPVVVLIHGFTFSPALPRFTPHDHIFALRPRRRCWKALSWPRHLGFGRGDSDEGLCIAFGWHARGTIWQAWRQAQAAGQALADLVRLLQLRRAGPVDIVAHSLGARVALSAMATLPAGALGRVIFMAAAEFQSNAIAAVSTPCGQTAEIFNITSSENNVFDLCLERLVRPLQFSDRALGAGLWIGAANWIDVQVDRNATRRALAGFGRGIPAPKRRICHWWGYLRPGLLLFYRDLIRDRERLSFPVVRDSLAQADGELSFQQQQNFWGRPISRFYCYAKNDRQMFRRKATAG